MSASTTYLAPVITKHVVVCPVCQKDSFELRAGKSLEVRCTSCDTPFRLSWDGFNAPVRVTHCAGEVTPAA